MVDKTLYVSSITRKERMAELTRRTIATVETPERLRQTISGFYQIQQIEKLLTVLEASIPPLVLTEEGDSPPVMKPALINLTQSEIASIKVALDHRQKMLDRRMPQYKAQEQTPFEDEDAKKVSDVDRDDLLKRVNFLLEKAKHTGESDVPDLPAANDDEDQPLPAYLT